MPATRTMVTAVVRLGNNELNDENIMAGNDSRPLFSFIIKKIQLSFCKLAEEYFGL
jgi:hypothetical protein